jgi:hypothetical protein
MLRLHWATSMAPGSFSESQHFGAIDPGRFYRSPTDESGIDISLRLLFAFFSFCGAGLQVRDVGEWTVLPLSS